MLPQWLLRGWVAAVGVMTMLFSLTAMQSIYSSGSSAGLFGAETMALAFNGLLGGFVIYALDSIEKRLRALEERQRVADAQRVPVSVQTDPAYLPPPSSEIQSSRPEARD